MKDRIIGISGCNFSEEQMKKVYEEASQIGMTVKELPEGCTDARLLSECEVLVGEYDLRAFDFVPNLKWYQTSWAGVDDLVKLSVFKNKKAILTNAKGAYGEMITEHVLGGCLMLLRHFPGYLDAQRKHQWSDCLGARAFRGKKVTVLGVGNVGGTFAQAAYALGAKVSGMDMMRTEKPEWLENLYSGNQLNEAVEGADIVVMCLPYTKETHKIVGEEQIEKMGKDALLVNVGRGPTLDVEAVEKALESGRLAGAMLDVFPEEPLAKEDPIWDIPNLIITPHVSGHGTDQANIDKVFEIFMENLRRWGNQEVLQNVVMVERGY